MRWTFGVEPLPGSDEAARLLREITNHLLVRETDDGEIERACSELRTIELRLRDRAPTDLTPRIGGAAPDGRVYVDHARDIGAFNPCFPEYAITVEANHAYGTVTFPIAFEGPPGIVHGGFLAAFFDCVIQHHNCELGVAGKTASLSLRYRRPTPLLTELRFTVDHTVVDDRIVSSAQLLAGDVVCCAAEMSAVASTRTALPEVSPRRSRP